MPNIFKNKKGEIETYCSRISSGKLQQIDIHYISTVLQLETVQCHLLVIFGTKIMKHKRKKKSDLTHYSPARKTSVSVAVYLLSVP